jgi:small subunit ribosomal protein S16
MLKIKLARFGKRKQPHYRIVINEARDKRDGSYVAQVGRYVPTETPKVLEFNVEEYKGWLKKGAQPTDTVASLFTRFESGNPFPEKKPKLSRKAKAKLEAAKQEVEEAKNKPVEKPKVEEPKVEAEAEKPAAEEPKVEVKTEEAKPAVKEEVKVEEPKAEKPKAEETKTEEAAK